MVFLGINKKKKKKKKKINVVEILLFTVFHWQITLYRKISSFYFLKKEEKKNDCRLDEKSYHNKVLMKIFNDFLLYYIKLKRK